MYVCVYVSMYFGESGIIWDGGKMSRPWSRPTDPCESRVAVVFPAFSAAHTLAAGKKVSVPPGHAASVKETSVGGCADCRCHMTLAPHAGQERKTETSKIQTKEMFLFLSNFVKLKGRRGVGGDLMAMWGGGEERGKRGRGDDGLMGKRRKSAAKEQ